MTGVKQVRGVFRDRAPHVEAAVATVVAGELHIQPLDPSAYPPDFVLRTSRDAVVWTGDLRPPMDATTVGQQRVAAFARGLTALVDPIQGGSGTWVIFDDGESAFRPDDPERLAMMLRDAQVPIRDGSLSGGPPEPNGGLLALGGFLALLLIAVPAILLTSEEVAVTEDLSGWATLAVFVAFGFVIGAVLAIRRFWMRDLLIGVSRRQRRRAAVDGQAQPLGRTRPGLRSIAVLTTIGFALGAFALAMETEPTSQAVFLGSGALVGLSIGLVWTVLIRLFPMDPVR